MLTSKAAVLTQERWEKNGCVKKNGNTPGRRKLNLFTSGVMCVLRIDLLVGVCVCSQANSKACLGVTVRYTRVPRVKMGLFDKWQLEKNNNKKKK